MGGDLGRPDDDHQAYEDHGADPSGPPEGRDGRRDDGGGGRREGGGGRRDAGEDGPGGRAEADAAQPRPLPPPAGVPLPPPPEPVHGPSAPVSVPPSPYEALPVGSFGQQPSWETITATLALVPFVQAVSSAFGSRLADAIDGATRSALRRFLRDQAGRGLARQPSPGDSVNLVLDGGGAQVTLFEDTPAEAVAQLVAIDFAALDGVFDAPPRVVWLGQAAGRQRWCALGGRQGRPFETAWQHDHRRWSHQEYAPAAAPHPPPAPTPFPPEAPAGDAPPAPAPLPPADPAGPARRRSLLGRLLRGGGRGGRRPR